MTAEVQRSPGILPAVLRKIVIKFHRGKKAFSLLENKNRRGRYPAQLSTPENMLVLREARWPPRASAAQRPLLSQVEHLYIEPL